MMTAKHRVAVTGMGAVTPVGCSIQAFWEAVCRGTDAMRPITRFKADDFSFQKAGEIVDFRLPDAIRMDPGTDWAAQFMAGAAYQAVQEAGIADFVDTAVVLATNFGGIGKAESYLASTFAAPGPAVTGFQDLAFQAAVDRVANLWNYTGPRVSMSLSCSSGGAALGYGAGLIRSGRARTVIAGGYDALSRFAWSGLSVLRTMSKDAVRPFDRRRDGTLFSEGAGAIVLEDFNQAVERGIPIYAELIGYGLNNNAYHMTAPAKEGAGTAAAMQMALHDAGIAPGDIDHINAHGTGTKPNDVTETQAIKAVFGDAARRIPITSIKSSIGHLMGAAGSVEAIASILSLRDGILPPTTHFAEPDPDCDLDYVFNEARRVPVRTVLSNSAGIGGCNAVVIFRSAAGNSPDAAGGRS